MEEEETTSLVSLMKPIDTNDTFPLFMATSGWGSDSIACKQLTAHKFKKEKTPTKEQVKKTIIFF